MHLSTDIKSAIKSIGLTLTGSRPKNISLSNDQVQCSTEICTVIFGLHSLRLSIVNNIDNTAIVITPCDVVDHEGTIIHSMGTTYHIFSTEDMIKKEYNTLNVDAGELFQMGTLHECDFRDNSEILPLMFSLLDDLENNNIKVNAFIIPQAKLNVTEAMEKYNAMA